MMYLVLYEAGKCGTWLTWFINQHKNFPKYDYKPQCRNLTMQVDISCSGADWWPEKQTFEENRSDAFRLYSNDITSTKDCIKILPNHNCAKTESEKHYSVNRGLLKKYTYHIDNVIIPIVSDILLKEIYERWIVLAEEATIPVPDISVWKTEFQQYNLDNNNFDNLGFNFFAVDIGKLISGYEDEYKKLLEFIDEEPIDNWKEIVYNYKEFAFNRETYVIQV